jgi:hypothetical protein
MKGTASLVIPNAKRRNLLLLGGRYTVEDKQIPHGKVRRSE